MFDENERVVSLLRDGHELEDGEASVDLQGLRSFQLFGHFGLVLYKLVILKYQALPGKSFASH
jgi:hypothetical protein